MKFQHNMSKHVGEKCGKQADGDPDGRTESRTDRQMDGRTTDKVIPKWRSASLAPQ